MRTRGLLPPHMMAATIGQLSCIGIVAGTGIGASPIIAPFSFNGVLQSSQPIVAVYDGIIEREGDVA